MRHFLIPLVCLFFVVAMIPGHTKDLGLHTIESARTRSPAAEVYSDISMQMVIANNTIRIAACTRLLPCQKGKMPALMPCAAP